MTCTDCNPCQEKKCGNPCGCAEPVFSIEAMPDDPATLRFNVNGKSVWYDFSPVVKAAETCTTLSVDALARTLNYIGECGENTITARELGSILHLADIADVDENAIDNYGILEYQKDDTCGEGCEGTSNGWVARNPIKSATESLSYLMGTNEDGKMQTLLPPTDANKFSYLTWAAQNKAKWTTPTVVATPPLDSDNKAWRLYLDPNTLELVVVKEDV